MTFAKCTALLLATATTSVATASPAAPEPLKLERVVMLMRHGIRPPTKANPVPAAYSSEKWPSWPVDFGLLTPRGAAGVKLLGEADRALYAKRGMFGDGCPAPGTVVLKASGKQRAIRTAESWSTGFMPGCAASVDHPTENGPDPIFHGFDDHPETFDGVRALREAQTMAPKGGIEAETRAAKPELALLARVLACPATTCPLTHEPSKLSGSAHDRPDMTGPLDVGSTASQTLLLEYLEGMPMQNVGWGRVTRPQIEQMLKFHPIKFKYSNYPDYITRSAATPLAGEFVTALTAPNGPKLTLLAGHDTNIADMAGFLRVQWKVPSYPANDVPPGSAIGLELLRDAKGAQYVRAFYRAQTMDQLREQRPLVGTELPYRQYLPMPGCGNSTAATACTLDAFVKLAKGRMVAN